MVNVFMMTIEIIKKIEIKLHFLDVYDVYKVKISSVHPSFLYINQESAFIYYVKTKVCEISKKLKKFFTK